MSSGVILGKSRSLIAIAALALVSSSHLRSASASLLWYDGFETGPGQYIGGAPIGGQSGGTGSFFTGPWIQPGADAQQVNLTSLVNPPQLHPSLGGSLGDDDAPACCVTGRSARMFAQPWTGVMAPVGTFYIGFLAHYGHVDGGLIDDVHHRTLEMWEGGVDDAHRNLMLGYSTFSGLGSQLALAVRDSTSTTTVVKQLNEHLEFINDNQAHYLVLKFELSNTLGADKVSAFLDPAGVIEPAVPSASISGPDFSGGLDLRLDSMGGITQFSFFGGNFDHAASMDEIRVGTTFNDVALSFSLLGDFDSDGLVNVADYLNLVTHLHTDVTLLTLDQSYALGDITRNNRIDALDFLGFEHAFDVANGEGAFTAMVAAIPEPSAAILAAIGFVAWVGRPRARMLQSSVFS